MAHLRQCLYERDHHVRLGRKVGITPELLERIERGPESAGLTPRQQVLLASVGELVEHKNISEVCWRELQGHYSSAQLVELCLLVGQYEALATTIATLQIERDF